MHQSNIKYQSIICKVNSASKGDWIKKDQDTYLSLGSPGYISFLPAKGSSIIGGFLDKGNPFW